MKYRVHFQMEAPPDYTVRRTELPALPGVNSRVILGPGLVGLVRSISLCIDDRDEALYLVFLTPLDTPDPTS